ncbi:DUF1800 domain-containing protein [Anthocerotibacter panamensis]|uniref:DUF1800 domain-containing protein n=1 Tax=Anthocerotibacter panamensis TaxID=2857077 RepID=UPI001C4027CD|nr:DUF1800 domain-containing protein [Anthocerotibacter panamensis]
MDANVRKAHFFRRASFGATLAELEHATAPKTYLEQWLADPAPKSTIPSLPLTPSRQERPLRRRLATPDPALLRGELPTLGQTFTPDQIKKFKARNQERRIQGREFAHGLLEQLVTAPNPLHERMVNFWRDHFVVSAQKVKFPGLLAEYDTRLRASALGDFQELLWNVTISPAMLAYLDNGKNRAGEPNENYSRELLELFTLGRGHYSEQDVKEGARALTGWALQPLTGQSRFVVRRFDNGSKNYLNHTGNLKAEDVVEIVANHPATARLLATELWTTFAYPDPEPAVIERIARVYTTEQRNLKAVVHAIFTAPEFYSDRAYRSHLKSPMYFVLGTLRQLEIQGDYRKVLSSLKTMGQPPYGAPSVKGWPDDAGWLNAPSLLTRVNLAQQFTQDYGDEGSFVYDPDRFTPEQLTLLLLDGNRELQPYTKGLSAREICALLLASPLYQLA